MESIMGEIRMFAGNFAPKGWAFCDGQQLDWSHYDVLSSLISTTYGGTYGEKFNLPNMKESFGTAPMGMGDGPGLSSRKLGSSPGGEERISVKNVPGHRHQLFASAEEAKETAPIINELPTIKTSDSVLARGGAGTRIYSTTTPNTEMASTVFGPVEKESFSGFDNKMASTYINFIISTEGIFPSRDDNSSATYTEAFIGEISIMPYDFVPKGWEPCDGQFLSMDLYPELYMVISNTFGLPHKGLFRLPDLRARVAIGNDGQKNNLGAQTGSNRAALPWPEHTHAVMASSDTKGANSSNVPEGNTFGYARFQRTTDNNAYGPLVSTPSLIELNPKSVSTEGNTGTIYNTKNMQPYLGVQHCICASPSAGVSPERPDDDGDE